ncbi:MAG: DinB family protein [Pseudonocardiaceae bacterium]
MPLRDLDAAERTATADERTTLEAFLDHYRDLIKRKVGGVSEEDARRRLVPSATTLGGLIKHLRWVEYRWFQLVLPGVAFEQTTGADRLAEFGMTDDETVAGLVAAYDEQCARSRTSAARYQLTDVGHRGEIGEVSLRWIYLHLIEETARHAGHADILREQLDGMTGD